MCTLFDKGESSGEYVKFLEIIFWGQYSICSFVLIQELPLTADYIPIDRNISVHLQTLPVELHQIPLSSLKLAGYATAHVVSSVPVNDRRKKACNVFY